MFTISPFSTLGPTQPPIKQEPEVLSTREVSGMKLITHFLENSKIVPQIR
jgi:hypothetical protein